MAYTWTTGETITAEKLNNTGNIFFVNDIVSDLDNSHTLDKTFREIADAFNTMVVVICLDDSNNGAKNKFLVNMIIDTDIQRVIGAKDEYNGTDYEFSAAADNEYPGFNPNGGLE